MSHFCQHCHHFHFESYFCTEKRLAVDELVHAYSSGKKQANDIKPATLADQYPKYYKDVRHLDSVDVYRVHRLFGVTDNELHHASKKILLCGVRTGNKPARKEIEEARDTLNRWLELEAEDERA